MKKLLMLLGLILPLTAVLADVHTWVGGSHSGGGWNNPLNWKNASGQNECPGKDDVALFNEWSLTVVANDSDAELVSTLAEVQFLNRSYIYNRGPTVIFDFEENHRVGCAIHGNGGKFIKRGGGTLYLENVDPSFSSGYGINGNLIPSPGGMLVEEGIVWFPQDSSLVFGSASAGIEVARGATVYLPNGANTMINWLKGDGTVTIDSEVERNLQVGMASESAPACEFAGRLTGKFSVNSYAGLSLSGTESDISKLQILRRAPGDHMNNGYVAMSRLGCKNEVSSIGTGPLYLLYCSSFRYLGDGETSDKNIYYDTRTLTGSPDAIIFDGGPNGGLNLTGSISSYGSKPSMMTLILDGSNSVACTVSGGFSASFATGDAVYTPYILKRGSGVWRFADNANRTHAGVYEVREGTLQFDTIAEAGEMCSLGFATNLSENYQGAYDSRRKVPYAYRLGSPDSTNAVFEYTGSVPGICATRPAVLSGDAHIRASGAKGAPLDFSGVSALSEGPFTLVLDGANGEANILRDVTDGAGEVSLVKDGPGSWTLGGRQSFSGSLTVKQGTLTVAGPRPFTYFRATFNDGYGSPYTSYITEVGLYDASGVRRNLDLAFELPAGKEWKDSWMPNNVAPLLTEGAISYDGGGNLAYYLYGPDDYALEKLIDGTSAATQFSRSLSPSSPLIVSMRLPDDVPEIVYFDFVQNSGNYLSKGHQTPSAFVLEGSADGLTWTTLLSTNNLEHVSGDKWRFSVSGQKLAEYPGDRDVAAGEALAFSVRAVESGSPMLENVGTVSVSSGATLRTTGVISPVISRLKIDAAEGIGNISGFTFADEVEVDVVGIPRKCLEMSLPFDFSSCSGFSETEWKFTADGMADTHIMKVVGGKLKIYRRTGTKIVVR